MVQKLSGFAKFDLDLKINRYQFYKLIEEISSETVPDQAEQKRLNFETFRQISDLFARTFDPATTTAPFDKDLDNPIYQKIV